MSTARVRLNGESLTPFRNKEKTGHGRQNAIASKAKERKWSAKKAGGCNRSGSKDELTDTEIAAKVGVNDRNRKADAGKRRREFQDANAVSS